MPVNNTVNEQYSKSFGLGSSPARRSYEQVKAFVENVSPAIVDVLGRFVGTMRDAIRVGQYQVGPPYVYSNAVTLTAGQNTVLPVNVPANGTIRSFQWGVFNQTATPADAVKLAGVTSVGTGALQLYEAVGDAFPQPATSSSVTVPGPYPFTQGLPFMEDGFARRIDVAQGDIIKVACSNNGADTYQIVFFVEQYYTEQVMVRK